MNGVASSFINDSREFLASIKGRKVVEDSGKAGDVNPQQQYYISKIKSKDPALKNAFQATVYFEDDKRNGESKGFWGH